MGDGGLVVGWGETDEVSKNRKSKLGALSRIRKLVAQAKRLIIISPVRRFHIN